MTLINCSHGIKTVQSDLEGPMGLKSSFYDLLIFASTDLQYLQSTTTFSYFREKDTVKTFSKKYPHWFQITFGKTSWKSLKKVFICCVPRTLLYHLADCHFDKNLTWLYCLTCCRLDNTYLIISFSYFHLNIELASFQPMWINGNCWKLEG